MFNDFMGSVLFSDASVVLNSREFIDKIWTILVQPKTNEKNNKTRKQKCFLNNVFVAIVNFCLVLSIPDDGKVCAVHVTAVLIRSSLAVVQSLATAHDDVLRAGTSCTLECCREQESDASRVSLRYG